MNIRMSGLDCTSINGSSTSLTHAAMRRRAAFLFARDLDRAHLDPRPLSQAVVAHRESLLQIERDTLHVMHIHGLVLAAAAVTHSLAEPGSTVRETKVHSIVTDRDFQGYGIGTALMDYVVRVAQSSGDNRVVLRPTPEAVGFYEHLGFTAIQDQTPLTLELDITHIADGV